MTRTAFLLFLSSCSTAIIHALIPDHWLPFVLMSRVERWSERRVAALTGLAGLLHVLVTMLAGGLTILIGSATVEKLAARTGRSLDFLVGLLLLVAAGYSNTEIGARLYVGDETVKTHVSRILAKLGLRDRIHAVVYAHRHGLLTQ